MTSTTILTLSDGAELQVDASTEASEAAGSGQGKTSPSDLLLAYVKTATADEETNERVRGLLAELIAMGAAGEGAQLDPELETRRRDVWEHLYEALTPHPTA